MDIVYNSIFSAILGLSYCSDYLYFTLILILKVKEWLQNLGIGDHATVIQDEEADDEAIPSRMDEIAKNRCFLVKCS